MDEGAQAEERGADLEEEGAGVAVLGEKWAGTQPKLGFSTMLRVRQSLYMQSILEYYCRLDTLTLEKP